MRLIMKMTMMLFILMTKEDNNFVHIDDEGDDNVDVIDVIDDKGVDDLSYRLGLKRLRGAWW